MDYLIDTTVQQPEAPVYQLTKRAFQNRFPLLADGVSRTYDAMSMFLTNEAFATSLVADTTARQGLQLMIQTGLNRMNASAHVDLLFPDAANFTLLLMQASIPSLFRLTSAERDVILSKVIADSERPAS